MHAEHGVEYRPTTPYPRKSLLHASCRKCDKYTQTQATRQFTTLYSPPGFHSGYNEVILNSKAVNARMPAAIEASALRRGGLL